MADKEKYIEYGDYVKIKKDDIIGASVHSIQDLIMEAHKKAIQEGIQANMVILDKNFAKTNGFYFSYGFDTIYIPPMICGLEVQISDELPKGCDFAVIEAAQTQRDRVIAKTKQETAREILEEIERETHRMSTPIGEYTVIHNDRYAELKKKYIGE